MKEITEFLYHILGVCGEHTHPHLINVGFIAVGIYAVVKLSKHYKFTK
tara:strand:- start:620 stop:763 length:144 start_codon:yes stop_codon:yes gene_type:complete